MQTTTAPNLANPPHAKELRLSVRIVAYVTMLSGYLFYCYNYLVLDYIRPYLMSDYGISLHGTASLYLAQSLFVTLGALLAAPMVARLGRRKSMFAAAFSIGILAIACALTNGFNGWLGARSLMAIFLAAYYVVAINLTVALFPPQYRAKLAAISSGLFSVAEVMVGGLGAAFGDTHWVWMIWVGAVPLLLSPFILLLVPEDKTFLAYGSEVAPTVRSGGWTSGWREMLSPKWRRLTLSCVLLAGLNFTGYQVFSGFVTLYLKQVRHFEATEMGATVALIGTGSLLGGFFWAFIADRYGRKMNAIGFVGTALFICMFLIAPHQRAVLQTFGFLYGFCLACAYPWGIYFTEIFPVRLRPYGAALFHAGHFVALGAPLVGAWLAERSGLATAMALGPTVFFVASIVWLTLPETLRTARRYRGWDPEAQ